WQCRKLPYYHAVVYYVMFSHLLDQMRERLGGIDDDVAFANAFFWYRVVTDYSFRIEPGSSPLENEMEYVEGAPTLYFGGDEFVAILGAAEQYVAAHPRKAALTEHDWLTGTDPAPLLQFLRGKAGGRKLRLFACACCRHVWHLLPDEQVRGAVETAERFADGLADVRELTAARLAARARCR